MEIHSENCKKHDWVPLNLKTSAGTFAQHFTRGIGDSWIQDEQIELKALLFLCHKSVIHGWEGKDGKGREGMGLHVQQVNEPQVL